MTLAISIGLIAILGGIWYTKQESRHTRPTPTARIKEQHPFAGVEIRCGMEACAGARALQGTKLLAAAAPTLPLPYCRAKSCRCGYEKLEDRREDHRRSIDDGIQPLIFDGIEQRLGQDRRAI